LELAARTAISLNSDIASVTVFDRKHYFYPDLPNGFQLTQYQNPFSRNGKLQLYPHNGVEVERFVGIEQIQIEQDSGKTVHGIGSGVLLDLNRAGVGILEIVTKPELQCATFI
jgi:aspartyl-tRNA(Asn)/glutamyl-tRNA(Gln) amidotransferase subunit B